MQKIGREAIRKFYENHPYPNQYVSSRESLQCKKHAQIMKKILACAGIFSKGLEGLEVLDAGCGTGEKAAWLAMHGAKVDAFDFSSASICIAKENAKKLGLEINYFAQDFESFSPSKKYGLVIAIGSLHHTLNAQDNFFKIASAAKSGGRIVIGLYNAYGRLGCRVQRKILRMDGKQEAIDKLRLGGEKNKVKYAVIADRLASPYESYHTVQEALLWFEKAKIEPVGAYPKVNLGSKSSVYFCQLKWLLLQKGFFFIGGRKK